MKLERESYVLALKINLPGRKNSLNTSSVKPATYGL